MPMQRKRRARPAPLLELLKLAEWKLLRGSHEWPGPSGGTCIIEAAVVVAGYPYRAVRTFEDVPPDFCPVISAYALTLNDLLPDNPRQELIRFVPRMAGSADPSARIDRSAVIVD